jgi:hypothetical protein
MPKACCAPPGEAESADDLVEDQDDTTARGRLAQR